MSKKDNRWKLGLFVLLALFSLTLGLAWLGALGASERTVAITSYFDESVDGLQLGSPVKYRGVPIGRVDHICIAPDRRHVQVRMLLSVEEMEHICLVGQRGPIPTREPGRREIPENVRVKLIANLLTGMRHVAIDVLNEGQISRYPPPEFDFGLPEGYVPALPSLNKSAEDWFEDASMRLPLLGMQVERLVGNLNTFSEEDLPRASRRFERLVDTTTAKVDALDVDGFNETLRTLREKAAAVDIERINGAVAELREAVSQIRKKIEALDIEGLTREGLATLENSTRAIDEVKAALLRLESPVLALIRRVDAASVTLETAVREARLADTTSGLREASASVRTAADRISEVATGIETEVAAVSEETRKTLQALRAATEEIRSLADLLERDPGSLLRGRAPARGPAGRDR